MDIQIATLCDFAADYGNGKMVINGTFDALRATKLEAASSKRALQESQQLVRRLEKQAEDQRRLAPLAPLRRGLLFRD